MTLGGVTYQNIPFNGENFVFLLVVALTLSNTKSSLFSGWFVSTEIVRNLMERYNAGPAVAGVLGIDTHTNASWRYAVAYEVSEQNSKVVIKWRGQCSR